MLTRSRLDRCYDRDTVDFVAQFLIQAVRNGRACRIRWLEIFAVDAIEGRELHRVAHVITCAYDPLKAAAGGNQNGGEILERTAHLFLEGARDQRSAFVYGRLTRYEQELTDTNRGTVWQERLGQMGRGHVFDHIFHSVYGGIRGTNLPCAMDRSR